jgi:hypothetical protein
MRDFVQQRHEGEMGVGRRRLAAATGCFGTPSKGRAANNDVSAGTSRRRCNCLSSLLLMVTLSGCMCRLQLFMLHLRLRHRGRAQGQDCRAFAVCLKWGGGGQLAAAKDLGGGAVYIRKKVPLYDP